MSPKKKKLVALVLEQGLAADERNAQALIMSGAISVEGHSKPKAGELIPVDAVITLRHSAGVGRGSEKLRRALECFPVSPRDKNCVDLGASTGGFTQILLAFGAAKVTAIDTAYGELAWELRTDPRVVVVERTNVLHLPTFPELFEFVTVDLSFTPLEKALLSVRPHCKSFAPIVALLKPQYEAPDRTVTGIIPTLEDRLSVVLHTLTALKRQGLVVHGIIPSPIRGMSGNQEYLVWLAFEGAAVSSIEDLVSSLSL